jgi:hypothetical protein
MSQVGLRCIIAVLLPALTACATAPDTVRITEYQRQVEARADEALTISREPCRDGGTEVVPGTYWICP